MGALLPAWAEWRTAPAPFTVGIEEEVMLIDPCTGNLASRVDAVLAAAPDDLLAHLCQETHGSAVELRTDPFPDGPAAVAQLGLLRVALRETLAGLDLQAAAAGTHPFATWQDVHVSAGGRQQAVHGSVRELARREPTFALHVHVGVADPEVAVRALNRMREHVPLLLALSANSPFWQGRDSGLASARTPLFQAFPRAGLPRAFADYADYVSAQDVLIRSGAIAEASFIWWDVRLQPRYGTLEVRVMDAQTTLEGTAALVALVRSLVQAATEDDDTPPISHEVLDENRFLALRDGVEAELIDADGKRVAIADLAAAAGADPYLLADPGAAFQRRAAEGERGLITLVDELVSRF